MKRLLIWILLGLALAGCGDNEKAPPVAVNGSIRVAAFNVQVFGQSKRSKPEVMDILTRTAREFDVMLVQEIRDASETTAQYYLDEINDMAGPGYSMVSSLRLGRTSSKEAYAYYWNAATADHEYDSVQVFRFDNFFGIVDQELIEDVSDHFGVFCISPRKGTLRN